MNQTEMLRFLQDRVSEGELKTICFHLQVDYESLPAVGKGGRALELIKFMLPELEAIISRFGAVGEGTPDSVKPYLKVIAQRTNRLPLAPLDPQGRDATAISLEQVFINLDAGVQTYQTAHAEQENVTIHQRYSAALAHIHYRPHLILLGDPGSGKSTLLRFLTHCLAQHGLAPDKEWTKLLRWQQHKETGPGAEMPDFLAQLGVNQQQLERLLWEIAWRAHSRAAERQESADIAETEVMGIAKNHLGSYQKAEQFVEYTERRAHLLVGHGGQQQRVYRFPHRTFQEYLAACYVASQRDFSRGAPKLAQRGDSWREVLNLAAGTLVFNQNNVEKALDGIREVLPERVPAAGDTGGWYPVWLAAEMMLVVGKEVAQRDDVGRKVLPRLQRMLTALLAAGALTPPQRAEAGDALGLLGDPRPGVCTQEPDLIPIAAGPFLMHDNKVTVQVDAFAIARYPVTNAQYRFFVEAGGYENPDFWTKEGWQQRGKEKWTQPRFWDDPFTSIDNKPVVGVSWYEAVAYCNWLSAVTEKPYRLPTEVEWERAARHTDGRKFPWGEQWQDGIINSREAGVGRQTTAVGSFPHSTAVCGAQDMSGNVWEWCQTRWVGEPYRGDDGRENLDGPARRVVRGGSWDGNQLGTRAAYRYDLRPSARLNNFGFRVVVRRPPSHLDH